MDGTDGSRLCRWLAYAALIDAVCTVGAGVLFLIPPNDVVFLSVWDLYGVFALYGNLVLVTPLVGVLGAYVAYRDGQALRERSGRSRPVWWVWAAVHLALVGVAVAVWYGDGSGWAVLACLLSPVVPLAYLYRRPTDFEGTLLASLPGVGGAGD